VTVERAVRLLAGAIVLVSLALAHWVSPSWLWLTAFVGLNLLQSAFTNWCPAMAIFSRMGLSSQCLRGGPPPDGRQRCDPKKSLREPSTG
jgi:hypothetical protein